MSNEGGEVDPTSAKDTHFETSSSASQTLHPFRHWWQWHGRAVVVFGAFALPLLFASPLFEIPLQYRLHSESSLGIAYQVARILPALMTAHGVFLWLAWRSDWNPTRQRRIRVLSICAVALLVLPLICAWSQLISAVSQTEGWRNAFEISFRVIGSSQLLFFFISVSIQALLTLVGLRLAAIVWNISLVDPHATYVRRQARFTIASVLGATAVIAMCVASLQTLFRSLSFVDQPWLGEVLLSDALQRSLNVVLGIVTATIVARIGWPTLDVLIPRLGILLVLVIGLYYGAIQMAHWLPVEVTQSSNDTLLGIIPFPIALVLAIVSDVAIMRSLNLHLKWKSA